MNRQYHTTEKNNTSPINSHYGVVNGETLKERASDEQKSAGRGSFNNTENYDIEGGLLNNSLLDQYEEEIERAYLEYAQIMERIANMRDAETINKQEYQKQKERAQRAWQDLVT